MPRYAAFLRGINVSGKNPVKMTRLVELMESLGFTDVATYIQSGNVVFTAADKTAGKLAGRIEKALADGLGFPVPVVVRSAAQLVSILKRVPFPAGPDGDYPGCHVTMLGATPDKDKRAACAKLQDGKDKLILDGDECFLHCPDGYGRTKFTNTWLEKQLGVPCTTRNMATMRAVARMC